MNVHYKRDAGRINRGPSEQNSITPPNDHVQLPAHPLDPPCLESGMPVTVVARAAAEPALRNIRFIDIGGKASS